MERMTENDILSWLESDEAGSRPWRVERMGLLLDLFGQNGWMQFFGGVVPVQAFDEMRLAYLNGLYVSCVVVSQIVLEHILAGMFSLYGRDDLEGAGFQKLTTEGLAAGFISLEEFEELERLRRLRNPYTHSKPIMHPSCFVRRAAESNTHPAELFKQDAEAALMAVSAMLSRQPFSSPDTTPDEQQDAKPGATTDGGRDRGSV